MIARITFSVVVALALGAGIAYAATQLSSSAGTQVCVNKTTGLVRVADTCRENEYRLTIGGSGSAQVTQNGTFTVPAAETSAGKVLPLTGITVSGKCEAHPEYNQLLARPLLEAASGTTMDAFHENGGTLGGTSLLLYPVGGDSPFNPQFLGENSVIATSDDATATVTFGGTASLTAGTCTFLWEAVETPN